jgi:hypothetical protein
MNMSIKFKAKDSKDAKNILVARNDVQARAFKHAGLEFATKADEDKFKAKKEEK